MEAMRKFIVIFLVSIISVVALFPSTVYAQAGQGYVDFTTSGFKNTNFDNVEFGREPGKMTEKEADLISKGGLPNVHVEEASQFVEEKGFDLIHFLQRFVQPFAIIIFIFCALLSLVGAFGNASLVGKGIFGCVVAVVMYVVVLYAPELLDFFASWISS